MKKLKDLKTPLFLTGAITVLSFCSCGNKMANTDAQDSPKKDSTSIKTVETEFSLNKEYANVAADCSYSELLDKIPVKDSNKDFTAGFSDKNAYFMDTAKKLGLKDDAELLHTQKGKKGANYAIIEASNGVAVISDDGKTAVAGVIDNYEMKYYWINPDNQKAAANTPYVVLAVDMSAYCLGKRDYNPVKMGALETCYDFYRAARDVKAKNNNQAKVSVKPETTRNL